MPALFNLRVLADDDLAIKASLIPSDRTRDVI